MSRGRGNPELPAALGLVLRDGLSPTEAANRTGVPRTTISSALADGRDGLEQAPVEGDGLDGLVDADLIPVIRRDYSHLSELYVYPLGDLHIGAPAFQERKLDQWLDYLLGRKETSVLNTGDNFNCAIPNSVSDQFEEKLTVDQSRAVAERKFRPLAEEDRIDAIGKGNHENRVYRATGHDPGAELARDLGVPYWSTAALMVYTVGDVEYDVFVRHGSGGGATPGAKANKLQKQRNIVPGADVYVSGHTHSQMLFPEDILVRDGERLIRRKQMFVSSGSFLGLEAYAVEAGMAPTHVGAPRIRLDGRRHDPHASC